MVFERFSSNKKIETEIFPFSLRVFYFDAVSKISVVALIAVSCIIASKVRFPVLQKKLLVFLTTSLFSFVMANGTEGAREKLYKDFRWSDEACGTIVTNRLKNLRPTHSADSDYTQSAKLGESNCCAWYHDRPDILVGRKKEAPQLLMYHWDNVDSNMEIGIENPEYIVVRSTDSKKGTRLGFKIVAFNRKAIYIDAWKYGSCLRATTYELRKE